MKKAVLTAFLISVLIGSLAAGMPPIKMAMAQIPGDISINADGTVTGTDKIKQEGTVYSFISDIIGSVGNGAVFMNVLKDNIVIDGAGHSLKGTGTGIALQLQGVTNVTIKNVVVNNFGSGIYAIAKRDRETDTTIQPSNLKIINNDLKTTYEVISLKGTNNSIILDNTLTSYYKNFGLTMGDCYNNTIANNAFFGGGLGMHDLNQNTFSQNTLNGKALVVLENKSNITIEGVGQVFLFNCDNMTIKNIEPTTNHKFTVQLTGTNNSHLLNCASTITLVNSSNNLIRENYLPENGLRLDYSHNNTVTNNILTGSDTGISLETAHSNIIYGNSIHANSIGIHIFGSRYNSIAANNITAKEWGIKIAGNSNNVYNNNVSSCKIGILLISHNNTITRNIVMLSKEVGLMVNMASNNTIYHNNFILNVQQVEEHYWWEYGFQFTPVYALNNVWDDGEKGNFWSNYHNHDLNGDGIWDEPYQMADNFTDNYPLIQPINFTDSSSNPTLTPSPSQTPILSPTATVPEFPVWIVLPLLFIVIFLISGLHRKSKPS